MKIKWLGTATLLLESGGTRILLDPYLRGRNKKLAPVLPDETADVQAIFITHPHPDHFADVNAWTERGVERVFVSENGIRSAKKNKMDVSRMFPLGPGEMRRVGNFTVRTFKSRHCKFDFATVMRVVFSPRAWAHFFGTCAFLHRVREFPLDGDIYALEISDGEKTVLALGSAGMDEATAYPVGADLLVFPYQGRARMDKHMRKFLRVFQPKKVMLDHFDDAFPPLTHRENTARFSAAAKEEGAEGFVPEEGEWYEV